MRWCTLLCVLAALSQLGGRLSHASPERQLYRSDAKRWRRALDVARREGKSAVRHFLEERQQVG
jgi:hypothetical protein